MLAVEEVASLTIDVDKHLIERPHWPAPTRGCRSRANRAEQVGAPRRWRLQTCPFSRSLGLALLWQFFDEEFPTVRTLPGWRACEEIEDGLPDGRHARLWWRSPDSF